VIHINFVSIQLLCEQYFNLLTIVDPSQFQSHDAVGWTGMYDAGKATTNEKSSYRIDIKTIHIDTSLIDIRTTSIDLTLPIDTTMIDVRTTPIDYRNYDDQYYANSISERGRSINNMLIDIRTMLIERWWLVAIVPHQRSFRQRSASDTNWICRERQWTAVRRLVD
jgi:hypothetical protein